MRLRLIRVTRSEALLLEVKCGSLKGKSRFVLAVCTVLMCGGSVHEIYLSSGGGNSQINASGSKQEPKPRGIIRAAEGKAEGKTIVKGEAEATRPTLPVVDTLSVDA